MIDWEAIAAAPELVPVAELVPHPANPRFITPEQRQALAKAMQHDPQMLWARPIIRDSTTGYIVAGNQRTIVAQEDLDWDVIPVLTVALGDAQAYEWAVRDNQGFGQWQDDALVVFLNAAHEAGAALDTLGIAADELQALLDGTNADPAGPGAENDPDGIPSDVEARTKPGDLIRLGEHVLVCGDSHDPLQLDRAFAGADVAVVLTDPPYGISLDASYGSMQGYGLGETGSYRQVAGDDQAFDASFLSTYFGDVPEQFWFGADYYRRTLTPDDRDGSWLVWDKRTETSDAGFGSGFELIWSRQRHKRDLLRHLHFGMFGADARDRQHPTQKPVPLLVDVLNRWAPADAIVADPFLGSGSTLIACTQTGRVCRGLELDPAYCDVIAARWEQLTGQSATWETP